MIVQSSSYVYLPLFLIYTVPFGKVCTSCTFSSFFVRNNEDSVSVVFRLLRFCLVIDLKVTDREERSNFSHKNFFLVIVETKKGCCVQ